MGTYRLFHIILSAALAICANIPAIVGSPNRTPHAAEMQLAIEKLGVLGKVLYIAAHPDDENTGLISYFANGALYDTAYLSLTRGDGGQNLIGSELGEHLGVLRTQELLAARHIDGGTQFFTRARDFGFSKTPEETLEIWDHAQVLEDIVWVIRQFRPDVIVTRFRPEPGGTHGHHTASCILALEAFDAAGDPERFPDQLATLDTWKAKRVVWNTSPWFFRRSGQDFVESDYVALQNAGGYEPLLGKSFNEIASESRSMHKSQGFGTRIERGAKSEHFKLLAGEPMSDSVFDRIDTTWSRIDKSTSVAKSVAKLQKQFDPKAPQRSLSALLELRRQLDALPEEPWAIAKSADVDELIASCLGLTIVAIADTATPIIGEPLDITLEAINRSTANARIDTLRIASVGYEKSLGRALAFNQLVEERIEIRIPSDHPTSQPYWLKGKGSLGMFELPDSSLIGHPENPPSLAIDIEMRISDVSIFYSIPVTYRNIDPAVGETWQPIALSPPVTVEFDNEVYLFANGEPKTITATISAGKDNVSGILALQARQGWKISPENSEVEIPKAGTATQFAFEVTPPERSETASLSLIFDFDDKTYDRGRARIEYPHIPTQIVFPKTIAKAVSLEVERKGQLIGYIPGAGDSVPDSIREIGYEIELIDPDQPIDGSLSRFDAIVFGIRAYNTIESIDRLMDPIFEYAENGGVVIAQYNTSHRLKTAKLAPYPITLSRDRVTDENASIRILAPEHIALTIPNKISTADFDGWVQERGLYFPSDWDTNFTPLLSCHDKGEPDRNGGLLVAKYGNGYFVYTGYAWFRQLPAGVPGAYRLFANLLSLGSH